MAGLAAFGAAALVLAGCAATPEESPEGETTEEAAPAAELDFLACAVSDAGVWEDNSFNEAVYDGLLQAESELGVQIRAAESESAEDFAPNLQAMVDEGCDVIFAVGYALTADTNAFAAANPEVSFVTIDGEHQNDPPLANLKLVYYKMSESSYLAGYLAAAQSQSKVIATYGGNQIEPVTQFMDGFYYGAQAWSADSGQPVQVLGWDPATQTGDFWGSWADNDPIGKSMAASYLDQGADILFPVGGNQFGAAIEAMNEAGVEALLLGVDKDIAATSPEFADYILTSAEKRMGAATFDIIKTFAIDGVFNGEDYVGTIANSGTDISPLYAFDDQVDQSIKDRLAELKQGIVDGTIDPRS